MLLHLHKRGHWLTPVVAMKNTGWVVIWTPKSFWLEHSEPGGEKTHGKSGGELPVEKLCPPLGVRGACWAHWEPLSGFTHLVTPPLHLELLCFTSRGPWSLPPPASGQKLLSFAHSSVPLGWHGEEGCPFFPLPLLSWGTSRACSQGCWLPSGTSLHLCGLHWCLATQLWTAEQKLTSPYICTGLLWCEGQGRTLELFQIHSPVCRELNGT